MSLLGQLFAGWPAEEAATRALAYILDPRESPGMAEAFVGLLGPAGVPAFSPGRFEHEASQADDSRPDLTICDADGRPRVFVEATFWAGVPSGQPAAYLKELPDDLPSALVFVAPGDRIPGLWSTLRARCEDAPGIDLGDESSRDGDAAWARVGNRVLLVVGWRYVLDALRQAAQDDAVEQDIAQLRGLADRMEEEAFLPLKASEVADGGLARRINGYWELVDKIVARVQANGIAKYHKRWKPGSYRKGPMSIHSMRVLGKFDFEFGIDFRAWRDWKITPTWWVLTNVALGDWQAVLDGLPDVRQRDDRLYIPIRLKTDAEDTEVVDDAVEQMRRIADELLAVSQGA